MTGRFSRRDFVKTGTLASGAALVGPALLDGLALPEDYYREPLRERRPSQASQEVLVLGAGLAGLEAARQLDRAGHDVTVLEARTRPGGRIHTMRDAFPGDLYAEAGAMVAAGPHIISLLEELDLKPHSTQPVDGRDLTLIDGDRIRMTESGPSREWPVPLTSKERKLGADGLQKRLFGPVLKNIGEPREETWPPERLQKYDRMSYAEFLRSQGVSKAGIHLLRTLSLSPNFDQYSALSRFRSLWAFTRASEQTGVLDGGTDHLPEALAESIEDRIRYGAEVVRIERAEDGAGAVFRRGGTGREERIEADRLVCTVPFSALREIQVRPPFPKKKRRAIEELPYSTQTRVYLLVRERFWEEEGLSGRANTDRSVYLNVHPMARNTDRAVLDAQVLGEKAYELADRAEDEQIAFAAEVMEQVLPGVTDYGEGWTTYAWSEDPWARGVLNYFRPGQMSDFLPVISRPEGRVHFAGDHTSPFEQMDGAVASGRRVAREVDEAAKQETR